MSEKYAYEKARSPGILMIIGVFVFIFCVSYAVDGISEPYEKTVYKDRVVKKVVERKIASPPKLKVVYREPNLVRKFQKCLDDRNYLSPTVVVEEVYAQCKLHITGIKTASLLDKSKVITVYRKVPFRDFFDRCMDNMKIADTSRKHDVEYCTTTTAKHMRGLVEGAEAHRNNTAR
jgi:hypothetical protein